jgi:hypothetical protein
MLFGAERTARGYLIAAPGLFKQNYHLPAHTLPRLPASPLDPTISLHEEPLVGVGENCAPSFFFY